MSESYVIYSTLVLNEIPGSLFAVGGACATLCAKASGFADTDAPWGVDFQPDTPMFEASCFTKKTPSLCYFYDALVR